MSRWLVLGVLVGCSADGEPARAPPPVAPASPAVAATPAAPNAAAMPPARTCDDSPFHWEQVEPGYERLEDTRDVDGDGRPDRLVAAATWGSSEESRTAVLELTRDRSKIEVSTTDSFATMVDRIEIPPRLLEPSLAPARRAIAHALFGRLCDVPDPSLARVLATAPAWSPGRPALVESYAVQVDREWVAYASLNHKRTATHDLAGGLVERARRGSLVLFSTAHGVVVVDEAGDRHAWLHVTEAAELKLRFPSIETAAFRGPDDVVIELAGGDTVVARPPR